jgi:hypothetical protein
MLPENSSYELSLRKGSLRGVVCPKPCSTRVLTHYLNAISINHFGNQDP